MIQDTRGATQLPSVFFVWSGEEDIVCREDNQSGVIVTVLTLLLLLLLLIIIIIIIIIIMFHLNDFLIHSTYPA